MAEVCSNSIPVASHRRCVSCKTLLGCADEWPAGKDWRLCANCEEEGRRVLIRGRRQRYWKPAELAADMGVSTEFIRREIRRGRLKARPLPCTGPNGIRYLIPDSARLEYLGEAGAVAADPVALRSALPAAEGPQATQ